ncbi:carboxymuconolactone decarboxylase family protein, partial [Chitinimonas sp. BJB300]|uniref:carboxymuconolactone decarboxylase family protein n=1 Tax=Chitinimonas sp. BJB300 TaxID=1559339 RepID=UPI001183E421
YLSLNGALNKGKLDAALRERIALTVAEFNGCSYCLSAHTYLGLNVVKMTEAEIAAARDHHSSDAKTAAALHFAFRVASERGRVSDADLATLRHAGFDEAEVVEIVVVVALNVLTNYINNVAQTDIDFPVVSAK